MTKQELVRIIQLITNTYDNFKMTNEKMDSWYEILQDYNFEHVFSNLKQYIKQGNQFSPNPGQLLSKLNNDRYVPDADETREYFKRYEEETKLIDREAAERARIEAGIKVRQLLGVNANNVQHSS